MNKVDEKAPEVSYLVAEMIAQKRKSHTVGENLMMPEYEIMVGKMLEQNMYKKLKIIHFQTVQ